MGEETYYIDLFTEMLEELVLNEDEKVSIRQYYMEKIPLLTK